MTPQPPKAHKALGQHYLIDKNIIAKICRDFSADGTQIIEIGPGPGTLTHDLAKLTPQFFAIEKDQRFEPHLKEFLTDQQLLISDALDVDFDTLFDQLKWDGPHIWLVSNLPYNVATPLLMKFIGSPQINYLTLMFQKEVGEKLIPSTSKKNHMSSLFSLCMNYFDSPSSFTVQPHAFEPPPKVNSIVVSLIRKKAPVVPLSEFFEYQKFLRCLFQFKRKQVFNGLKQNYTPGQIDSAFDCAGVKRTDRAEIFNLQQVQTLYRELKKVPPSKG